MLRITEKRMQQRTSIVHSVHSELHSFLPAQTAVVAKDDDA